MLSLSETNVVVGRLPSTPRVTLMAKGRQRQRVMVRTVRMPSEADLPPGTVRDLVELLFYFYRAARRPTLRKISDTIRDGDFDGTASPETIRRMLHGTTVPAWPTVEAVFEILCYLAKMGADGPLKWENYEASRRWHLERRWHLASIHRPNSDDRVAGQWPSGRDLEDGRGRGFLAAHLSAACPRFLIGDLGWQFAGWPLGPWECVTVSGLVRPRGRAGRRRPRRGSSSAARGASLRAGAG